MVLRQESNLLLRAIPAGGSRFLPEDLVVDEFFSTVSGKNFDLCIISTRTKTH